MGAKDGKFISQRNRMAAPTGSKDMQPRARLQRRNNGAEKESEGIIVARYEVQKRARVWSGVDLTVFAAVQQC